MKYFLKQWWFYQYSSLKSPLSNQEIENQISWKCYYWKFKYKFPSKQTWTVERHSIKICGCLSIETKLDNSFPKAQFLVDGFPNLIDMTEIEKEVE